MLKSLPSPFHVLSYFFLFAFDYNKMFSPLILHFLSINPYFFPLVSLNLSVHVLSFYQWKLNCKLQTFYYSLLKGKAIMNKTLFALQMAIMNKTLSLSFSLSLSLSLFLSLPPSSPLFEVDTSGFFGDSVVFCVFFFFLFWQLSYDRIFCWGGHKRGYFAEAGT